MSLLELVSEMEQRVDKQRKQEQKTLQAIAAMTTPEFAEQAAETLDSRKHQYSFQTYLGMLDELQNLIAAGIVNCYALEAVQMGVSEEILTMQERSGQNENGIHNQP